VGNDRNSDSLFINIPKGLFPSPGAKLTTFSVISGSCNKVFVTPDGGWFSSTSLHQSSPPLFLESAIG